MAIFKLTKCSVVLHAVSSASTATELLGSGFTYDRGYASLSKSVLHKSHAQNESSKKCVHCCRALEKHMCTYTSHGCLTYTRVYKYINMYLNVYVHKTEKTCYKVIYVDRELLHCLVIAA